MECFSRIKFRKTKQLEKGGNDFLAFIFINKNIYVCIYTRCNS